MNRTCKYCLMVAALVLTGCAGKEIVREPIESKHPIPVPCITKEDLPKPVPSAKEFLTIDSEPGEKVKQILIENKRLRAQNNMLWAERIACTE